MNIQPGQIVRAFYLAAISAFVLFVAFDAWPKLHEIGLLNGKIKRARMAVKSLSEDEIVKQEETFRVKMQKFREVDYKLKRKIGTINKKIKSDQNAALVVVELEELAGKTDIELSSIRPLTSEIKDSLESQTVELTFQSSFVNLLSLIDRLGESNTYFIVTELDIRKNNPAAKTLDVRMQLAAVYKISEEESDAHENNE